jgi:adenylate cyclase
MTVEMTTIEQTTIGHERARLFQVAMGRELLRTEQQRVLILGALLLFLLAIFALLSFAQQLIDVRLRLGLQAAFAPTTIVVLGCLCYEVCIWFWITRLRKTNRQAPAWYFYVNAFLEVSLPTLALVASAPHIGSLTSLAGALPLAYFLFIFPTALSLNFRLSAFAGAVAGCEFLISSFLILGSNAGNLPYDDASMRMLSSPHQYVIKALLLFAGGLIAGYVAHEIRSQLLQAIETLDERDRAISIFGQHVSPQVVEMLLKHPIDFAGEERNVCVMFLDIRDFSQMAAECSPTEVMAYLNTLFGFMIPIVNNHKGIINKFLGDGFMAVFGAPVDDSELCQHAVNSAKAIIEKLDHVNSDGLIAQTRIGIGLHLGRAITGNVGGIDRKEYTVIGDVVNLASRIEQATKTFNARLLASEAVVRSLGLGPELAEDLGYIDLKGQANKTRLFKLS